MRALLLLASLSTVICVSVSGFGATWYVDSSVSSSGDGKSWDTAFKTIQEGIDAAQESDEVMLAPGLYFGAGNLNLDFGSKEISVVSRDGPWATMIGSSRYHNGVSHLGSSSIQGITITGAMTGVLCDGCSGSIEGCIFGYCLTAIALSNSDVKVTDCIITDSLGWCVDCTSNSSLTISGCTISGGGGVRFSGNSVGVMNDCTVSGSAEDGVRGEEPSNVALTRCALSDNQTYGVVSYGPSLTVVDSIVARNSQAGIHCGSNTEFSISGCRIMDNGRGQPRAGGGGLSLTSDGAGEVVSCFLSGNNAGRGGGVYSGPGHPASAVPTRFVNCTFLQNTAELGGSVHCGEGSCSIFINCTLWEGTAEYGSAVYCTEGSPVFTNCVLWGATPWPIYCVGMSSPAITYCSIREGWSGEGNSKARPLFLGEAVGDFRHAPNSPCVDAGSNEATGLPEFDMQGIHRIMFGGKSLTVDIGAYEFHIWPPIEDRQTGDLTLKWSSLMDNTYSVYRSGDMLTWELAADDVASMGDTVTTWIDPTMPLLLPEVPRRYYKIMEKQ